MNGALFEARKTAKCARFEAITVEMINPKSAMFFLAFLPLFTGSSAGLPVWAQCMLLRSKVKLMFGLADGMAVLGASSVVTRLGRNKGTQRKVQQLVGGITVTLDVRLALR